MFNRVDAFLQNKRRAVALAIGSLGVIAAVDALLPREMSLQVFYLVPIALISWTTGIAWGWITAWACAVTWFLENELFRDSLSPYAWWNGATLTAFFGVMAWFLVILQNLRISMAYERVLAQTDALTGVANRRHFLHLLETEAKRSGRYERPFTVAILDLDDFKKVNDTQGHDGGDEALRVTVNLILGHLRETDIVGRIGGDEFAILLPETGREGAEATLAKLPQVIAEGLHSRFAAMGASMGSLTITEGAVEPREVLRLVDELMYSIKKNGKNGVQFGQL